MASKNGTPTATEREITELLVGRLGQERFERAAILFAPTYVYLGQGARAHDASAPVAACAMARAALEATFYTFVSRKKTDRGWVIEYPKDKHGVIRHPRFDELADCVIKRMQFAKDTQLAIDRIKEDGDLSVHAAEKHDKLLATLEGNLKGDKLASFKFWPSEAETKRNLIETTEIVGKLIQFLEV